ncbi:MAG: aminomethyl-transferring glycine dehydrogenase subunit GcvPB, partial [Actinomycetota bacterium]|nr:aminomethyl-transferring glycine dehydrogenase subunit GcvPB [Actinomycetota bacterium]
RIVDEKKKPLAAVMVTNPNPLGIFEKNILKISEKMHKNGSFLYYDGANLNAIIGLARPGDMGFDIVHLNLHKTFSTPHGGGGPGAGPILVKDKLKTFLPAPVVAKDKEKYYLNYDLKNSIGKIKAFYGNFLVCLKAYCYLLSVGSNLRDISINAVLNANYLKKKLERLFEVPYDKNCMHEFVLSAKKYRDKGGSALHIAKRIIDYGIHPPTIYFPIIVEEAMMIEPTETEDIQQLDKLVNIFNMIIEELESNPEAVINAPVNTEIGKLDEIKALKEPILKY